MLPIYLQIRKIIHDINRRGAKTEPEKTPAGFEQAALLENTVRGDKRDEDEQVLRPLMNAEKPEPRTQPLVLSFKDNSARIFGQHRASQRDGRVNHYTLPAVLPDREVRSRIADIVKTFGKSVLQAAQFARPAQIFLAITSDHKLE